MSYVEVGRVRYYRGKFEVEQLPIIIWNDVYWSWENKSRYRALEDSPCWKKGDEKWIPTLLCHKKKKN